MGRWVRQNEKKQNSQDGKPTYVRTKKIPLQAGFCFLKGIIDYDAIRYSLLADYKHNWKKAILMKPTYVKNFRGQSILTFAY